MMIQIQPYDLELYYSTRSDIPIPDGFSRLHLTDTYAQMQKENEVYVEAVMKSLPVSDSKLEETLHAYF